MFFERYENLYFRNGVKRGGGITTMPPLLALRVPFNDSDRGGARPASVAFCPPAADFSLDGYKGASARPHIPAGGLEALTPRQRPKDTQAGTPPLVLLRLWASSPHEPEGAAGSASAGVELELAAEERLETVPKIAKAT